MRLTIPSLLSSNQVARLQAIFLDDEIKFQDEIATKEFYNLFEQYILCSGGIAIDHRNRLKNLFNQLPRDILTKIETILGPESPKLKISATSTTPSGIRVKY